MTDREMLECAALAAGFVCSFMYDHGKHVVWTDNKDDGEIEWNSLEDDGDALRLAVRLGVFTDAVLLANFLVFYDDEIRKDNQPTTATRYAITRVAAEVGKAIKSQNNNQTIEENHE